MTTLRNKFDALQEISETLTLNDEYENFINALIEGAAECILTKLRAKHKVPWETLAVKKRNVNMWKPDPYTIRETQLTPTLRNLKKAQSELNIAYPKEQTEYILDQINKIRDLIEDRQSRIAWQTVNGVSGRKSISRAQLKAANQEEWIHMWKEPKLQMNLSQKSLATH